ncbi:L-glutamate synthase [Aureococcus anophagefferens]|uniref:L-glutamate synthase n=1 Tax=Aureococcus anophagefferens TaxID=44056 RepID=A0ABR1FP06_AURAN
MPRVHPVGAPGGEETKADTDVECWYAQFLKRSGALPVLVDHLPDGTCVPWTAAELRARVDEIGAVALPLPLDYPEERLRDIAAKAGAAQIVESVDALLSSPKPPPRAPPPAKRSRDYERNPEPYREPLERVLDWGEINAQDGHDEVERTVQAARCMDCGTPFCQTHTGCPVNNLIPEFNSLVYQDQWRQALDRLHQTNNFPEFTGRVCPAPCEGACVAGLVDSPVTIKNMEYSIVERGFAEGWIVPRVPEVRTGFSVAVVGSGPAGLAAADVLNQAGHKVTVYEREDRPGGLLMYGIPNMKLDKDSVARRIDLLSEEGIEFVCNAEIGVNVDVDVLRANNDAVVLATGATVPRDLPVPGREGKGIHFAMEFLTANQKRLLMTKEGTLESTWDRDTFVTAEGLDVVVIGGGDTGTDCIGTSMRHRCKSVLNFELMAMPPDARSPDNPWPEWPKVFGVDYGHAEVAAVFGKDPREYGVITTEFVLDDDERVKAVRTSDAKLGPGGVELIPGSEREWPADLVILAMGFVSPELTVPRQLGLDTDQRDNIRAEYGDYRSSLEGVFAAGDCRRGQSLVVWAINEGRGAALKCDEYLMTRSNAQVLSSM